ncbi:putative toxin-antitoxin system toxin component, PIN family [Propionivibrio sp.]|uniref:putative toxin-antitoxin system toxin component, PIN family n=1 Tax=Propionivibrio sp. TaxID=2212460 RepID=UPI003BF409DA
MSPAKIPPRVVVDTNVVLSALVFAGGRLEPLRCAWQSGQFVPLACSHSVSELIRVLAYPKFKLSATDRQELLADYLPYCTTVNLPEMLPSSIQCRDANDLPFLHLALAGKADFLVSGDADLLSLAGTFVCPIVTAEEFIRRCLS